VYCTAFSFGVSFILIHHTAYLCVLYSLLHLECHSISIVISLFDNILLHMHLFRHTHIVCIVESIAFGVSFNLNLQSQSPWSLFNGTWQKRPGELDHRLRFENEETTLQYNRLYYCSSVFVYDIAREHVCLCIALQESIVYSIARERVCLCIPLQECVLHCKRACVCVWCMPLQECLFHCKRVCVCVLCIPLQECVLHCNRAFVCVLCIPLQDSIQCIRVFHCKNACVFVYCIAREHCVLHCKRACVCVLHCKRAWRIHACGMSCLCLT